MSKKQNISKLQKKLIKNISFKNIPKKMAEETTPETPETNKPDEQNQTTPAAATGDGNNNTASVDAGNAANDATGESTTTPIEGNEPKIIIIETTVTDKQPESEPERYTTEENNYSKDQPAPDKEEESTVETVETEIVKDEPKEKSTIKIDPWAILFILLIIAGIIGIIMRSKSKPAIPAA